MRAFFERLSDREKLFVAAGAAILALFVLLQLIVAPAIGWRAGQAEKRDRAVELYTLVSKASASAGTVAASEDADLETPILNVLTQSTGQFGIVVNYRNGREDGGVETNVAAEPAKLFEWLRLLESRYGIAVVSADIARGAADEGESVQAQLTLMRRATG